MIFHIPHNSTFIPPNIRDQFVLSDQDLKKELLLMTDHMTSELFEYAQTEVDVVIESPVSRLVVDVERFLNDEQEIMNKVGMGVIYKKTSCGNPLRKELSQKEQKYLIDKYYMPHHIELNYYTEKILNEEPREAQIIDCHSFPSMPLKYEFDQDDKRPDICIGTNYPDKEELLLEYLRRYVEKKGYSVDINKPFSGSIVPNEYFSDHRVKSLMIEVNRKLYMNERTGKRSQDFYKTKELIGEIVKRIRKHNFKD